MSELTFSDKARIELAVQWVDYLLGGRIPRARRREIGEELRSNLIEASKRVGAREAVRQLGSLRALAMSYVELYRGRLDLHAGAWAAVYTYAAIGVVSLAVSFAFATGVLSSGGHAATYSWWPGFGPFDGSASGHSFSIAIVTPAHLVLMALAFAMGSTYRLVLRR